MGLTDFKHFLTHTVIEANDLNALGSAINLLENEGRRKLHVLPTENLDGERVVFTVPDNYVSGSSRLHWNGLVCLPGDNYLESGADEFTLPEAPLPDDHIRFSYTVEW